MVQRVDHATEMEQCKAEILKLDPTIFKFGEISGRTTAIVIATVQSLCSPSWDPWCGSSTARSGTTPV